ncbi:MAG: hypothetical protein NC833_03515 [Candidatus Omnitrophica bacterium]|nr:hypothetical protein [Candidatus Omnitrophota bacterium]
MAKLMRNGLVKNNQQSCKKREKNKKWQKPVLEDVSGKVMAQPYIRFT